MHTILRNILLFLLSGCWVFLNYVHAQERNLKNLSDKKKYELVNKLIELNSYYNAIEILRELIRTDSTQKKYIFKLAECYYQTRNYTEALIWYPKLNENLTAKGKKNKDKESIISIATFHHAECLKNTGKYEEARLLFQLFANSNYRDLKGMQVKNLAKNEIKSCEFAMKRKYSDIDVQITHLGNEINSAYSDFAPTFKDDSTLIFTSYPSDSVLKIGYHDKHTGHAKIYESNLENFMWSEPKELEVLTPHHGHAVGGSYTKDRKRFYFSRCRTKTNGNISCKIYTIGVDSTGNFYKKAKKLKGPINLPFHSSSQPHVGYRKKGKSTEEVLFFVSNMRGSLGGTDIWYAPINKDGSVGNPVNCGKTINSIRDEKSPYYDSEAGVLYFSSNYHEGYGGFDIFKSKGWATKWQKPENLKLPVNSSYDDTYFTLLPENKLKGFISSNRLGSIPLTHPTCCEDLWTLEFKKPNILVVQAIDSLTQEPIKEAITIEAGKYAYGIDSSYNADTQIDYDTVFSNEDSQFLKLIKITKNLPSYYIIGSTKKVLIHGRKPGYLPVKLYYTTDSLTRASDVLAEKGSYSYKHSDGITHITLYMVKGEEKSEAPKVVASSTDTLKIKSTLKEQYNKLNEEAVQVSLDPKVDTFTDSSKKMIQEIDFTINLSFEYNAVGLNKQNANTLDSLVQIMKNNSQLHIGFTTHTDGIGSEEYNLELSKKRATFLADYLIKNGISRKRIKEALGVGESAPLYKETNADGSDNPEARKLNRRTEIRLFIIR